MSNSCRQADDSTEPPEKVHLIPDEWHIKHVGRLRDGRLYLVDGQLNFSNGETTDYVCTFVFDLDGRLISHVIETVGLRRSYADDEAKYQAALSRHLAALGECTVDDIWIRPFTVTHEGLAFGFVPQRIDDSSWYVVFMPGNTLAFYAPWDQGAYDT